MVDYIKIAVQSYLFSLNLAFSSRKNANGFLHLKFEETSQFLEKAFKGLNVNTNLNENEVLFKIVCEEADVISFSNALNNDDTKYKVNKNIYSGIKIFISFGLKN